MRMLLKEAVIVERDPLSFYNIGDELEILGIKGKVTARYIDDISDSSDNWDGPSYIIFTYVNSAGSINTKKLFGHDIKAIKGEST